jgi:hypothetical protein
MQMCDSFIWWLPPIRCGGGDAAAGLHTYQEIQEWLGKLQAQCKYFTATPSGSIADTAINSVYLLGMVCVRTLIC